MTFVTSNNAKRIQGRSVATTAPNDTEVLTWSAGNNQWEPAAGGGGGGAPTDAQYVVLAVNGTLTDERVLTGTTDQITITDNGAGSTVVLSTPQDLATDSDVTFANVTLGTGGALRTGTTATNTVLLQAYDNDTGPGYVTFGTLTAGNTPSFELDNTTLDTAIAKGTWTASGTWTIPAVTLGGTVSSNGQSFSGTIADLGTVTTVDINGGTLDGVTIGGATPAAATVTTLTTTGAIELGAASDTTIARVSAGVVSIEGVNIVTTSSTDTLTNKTFDANGTGNSITNIDVADLADGTSGELITWDSSGNPATVAVGTASQVLTSNGAGAAPTFQDAASGGGQTLYDAIVAPSGGDYTTLGAAITGGATSIFVQEGTYSESAITSAVANLNIVGANPTTTILSFGANNLTLSGDALSMSSLKCTFTTGIYVLDGANRDIRGCWFSKSGNGSCTVLNNNEGRIIGNKFESTQTDDAVHLRFTGDQSIVASNYFKFNASNTSGGGFASSTLMMGDTDMSTTGNVIEYGGSGTGNLVEFEGGVAAGNLIKGNASCAHTCVLGGSTLAFTGNYVNGGAIGLMIDAAQTVSGNYISGASDSVVFSHNSIQFTGNYVVGAAISAGNIGIEILNNFDENVIQGNYIYNTETAISVAGSGCDRNAITGNYIDTGVTTAISDAGTTTFIEGNVGKITDVDQKVYRYLTNTSGGQLVAGDIVTLKAVADGDEFTTTTTQGDDLVLGMVAETIADTASGLVQVLGKTTALKVNGTVDIAIGDFIGTYTSAGIGMKAAAGDMAIAIALEAYSGDDSNGVIDALLVTPRKI